MNEEYLAHHGIKGQKWGVRRFQNPDGTRTALGKSRNASMKDRIKARSEQKAQARAENRAKRAEERHEQIRQQVVRHPKDLYKHKGEFSKSEMESILKDIEFDRKIKDIRDADFKRDLEQYKRVKDAFSTTVDYLNTAKSAYNIAVDTHNTLLSMDKIKGERWTKFGEKKEEPKEDRSAIESIVRTGSAAQVKANIGRMTSNELENAMKRFAAEQTLDDIIAGKPKTQPKGKK